MHHHNDYPKSVFSSSYVHFWSQELELTSASSTYKKTTPVGTYIPINIEGITHHRINGGETPYVGFYYTTPINIDTREDELSVHGIDINTQYNTFLKVEWIKLPGMSANMPKSETNWWENFTTLEYGSIFNSQNSYGIYEQETEFQYGHYTTTRRMTIGFNHSLLSDVGGNENNPISIRPVYA